MAINRKQLEAVSNTAQNDATALAEVYRQSFARKLEHEIQTTINQELFDILNTHGEVAQTIVNGSTELAEVSIAAEYADRMVTIELEVNPVKLLKPKREKRTDNLQSLLPPEKPQLKAL